jgi:two-component system, response regulator PdtaR
MPTANLPATTVLVVEDNAVVRMCTKRIVEDAGYLVLTAGTADEALQAFYDHDEIGVLFTGIRMRGAIDGLALAFVASRLWPETGIVVASGEMNLSVSNIPKRGRFLAKPYSAAQLESALSRALAIA